MSRRNIRMRGEYSPIVVGDMKRCTFCGEMKIHMVDFAKNGTDPGTGAPRYRDDCKMCYNIRRRENATKKKHTDFVGNSKRRGDTAVDFSLQEWKEVVIYFGGECAFCGAQPRRGQRLTKDHLKPISEGGKTVASNIIPVCGSCNSSKQAEDFKTWYMRQRFFNQDRLNRIFKWRMMLTQIEGKEDKDDN